MMMKWNNSFELRILRYIRICTVSSACPSLLLVLCVSLEDHPLWNRMSNINIEEEFLNNIAPPDSAEWSRDIMSFWAEDGQTNGQTMGLIIMPPDLCANSNKSSADEFIDFLSAALTVSVCLSVWRPL